MKIQIEQDFILPSSASLVRQAVSTAQGLDQRHQIVKALVERFPAVRDMDMEDLIQFIATLPNMSDFSTLNDKLNRLHANLEQAKLACAAVADARLLMSDGSLSNEIENAIEKCLEVTYGPGRPYPPALNPRTQRAITCTCNYCQQGRQQGREA